MTPKDKADEICRKMLYQIEWNEHAPIIKASAKQCALIAVDMIIPIVEGYEEALGVDQQSDYLQYWKEVKNEINKL